MRTSASLVVASTWLHCVLASANDGCTWSCRYRAAGRLPTYMVPTSIIGCTSPGRGCKARQPHGNQTTAIITAGGGKNGQEHRAGGAQLFVAITTIPPRSGSRLSHAIDSLFKQRRRPDKVIVSAAKQYSRFPSQTVDFTSLADREGLEKLSTCEDLGPGTKLLCALPRLRQLAHGSSGAAFAVLLDDDLAYRKWALESLAAALEDDTASVRHAYSFDVYTLTDDGHAVTGALHKGLLVGAGHALFAIRISLLDGVEDFFACVRSLEPRALYHDDVVISMFLQDLRAAEIVRIGGTPYEIAAKSFPEVHDTTVSFLSPGALITLGQADRRANHARGSPSATATLTRGKAKVKPRARAKVDPPSAAAAEERTNTSSNVDVDVAGTELRQLAGGLALLANGSSVSEARKAYSRRAVNEAMGRVRARMRQEGLCGLRPNAPLCVGEWCRRAKEWGIGKHVDVPV